jgi:uncharacterized protein YndB with AHSA1/START domain
MAMVITVTSACQVLANDIADTSYQTADGQRVLRHEVVVSATPEQAYQAFSTAEGWRTWAVPFAVMAPSFGVGAVLETSYNPAATPGDNRNIKNKILAYIPERMLAFQTVQAPTGFKRAELLPSIFTVAEFEPNADGSTRIRLSMLGYARGEAYDELYAFFSRGNAWSMTKLKQRFEVGPVNWAQELNKGVK